LNETYMRYLNPYLVAPFMIEIKKNVLFHQSAGRKVSIFDKHSSLLCDKKKVHTMRLCHPPDGSTSPKYKLLHFKPP
jgi:hypothetical protein